jgi:hypothetical protein
LGIYGSLKPIGNPRPVCGLLVVGLKFTRLLAGFYWGKFPLPARTLTDYHENTIFTSTNVSQRHTSVGFYPNL